MSKVSALAAKAIHIDEVSKALESSERQHWIEAMQAEINSLINRTKTLILASPPTDEPYDIVGSTCALKKKMKDVGILDKYKARLCVRGDKLANKNVDGMMISSTDESEIKKFGALLKTKFDITSEYDVYSHLGINMTRNENGIKLTQPKLLQEIIDQYPTDKSIYPAKVTRTNSNKDPNPIDRSDYLQLLGKLMYMGDSRPDILTAISYASTHNVSPTEDDYKRLLEIVGYLKATKDYGLTLHTSPAQSPEVMPLQLICYVDAAYMSHADASSHTGYTIALSSQPNPPSLFHSKSRKQKLVATSSTHAEIRALYELTIEVIYITTMLDELGRELSESAIIFEDNQPAIDLVTASFGRIGKSKHFLMTTNFIREQIRNGLINIRKVKTEENISNVLTMIINGKEFIQSFTRIRGDANYEAENTANLQG